MAQAAQINPRILSWARETAGLSLEEAAEKLAQAERGERAVPTGMLEKAVAVYRRPLIAFYLPEPPRRAPKTEDFRTVARAPSPRGDAMLDALVRDVRARQQLLKDALLDDEEFEPLPFVATSTMSEGAPAIAAKIRKTLGVTQADQRRAANNTTLFKLLRAATERAGI
ncbi:hypothetical protein [Roseicella aquatilis]|uniref:Uncharacterized protein n=1 Tax=Roseicella aquatilis TaxID=2527868 RepID=A0A4R4D3N9_9PROT|nr:hypothetical protein [Roseicella aquatilis]TCZ51101.1 hypothetical protein EXY23_27040 [Roseicella aquatilis]